MVYPFTYFLHFVIYKFFITITVVKKKAFFDFIAKVQDAKVWGELPGLTEMLLIDLEKKIIKLKEKESE